MLPGVRPVLASLVVMVAFAAFAATGLAQPRGPNVELEWDAPPGCPTKQEILDAVARQTPSADPSPTIRTIRARAVVEKTSGTTGWRVVLTTPSGERAIEGNTCDELGDAVALILALAIDPTRSPPPPPSTSSSPPPPLPTASPTASATAPDNTPAGAPGTPPKLAVGVAQTADIGVLPSAGIGVELAAAVRLRPIRLELAGAYWATNRATVFTTSAGGDFRMMSAAARGCVTGPLSDFELGGCGGLGIDRVSADSFGPIATSNGDGAWLAVEALGRAAWVIRPWIALQLGIGLHFPLSRPAYVIEGIGFVHRPSQITLRQGLGLELRFL
jgi:hypothetical protein